MKIKVGDKFTIPATVATVVGIRDNGIYPVVAKIDGLLEETCFAEDGSWIVTKAHPLDLREENRIIEMRTPQVGDVWEDERKDVHEVVLLREMSDGQTGVLALLLPRLYPQMFPVAHFTEHFTFVHSATDEVPSAPAEQTKPEPKKRIGLFAAPSGTVAVVLEGSERERLCREQEYTFLRYLED